ncbi:MAG TPA: SCO family protein [Sphingobacteriaceae bacterium]
MNKIHIITIITIITIIAIMLGVLPGTSCNPPAATPGKDVTESSEIKEESIYLAEGKWDNQNGDTLQLADFKGKIPVVSMVFTKCTFACPRIVGDMQAIEKQVPADKKDQVVFVLVSFDSDRDHTGELKQFTRQMNLGDNWQVLHGDEESVRELSMLLDVKYKKQDNGDFSHSSSIALLDTEGAIVGRVDGLGADPAPIVRKLGQL